MILSRHVNATAIICVNDPYDHTDPIKDNQRELCIQAQGHILKVFMTSGDQFLSSVCSDWLIEYCFMFRQHPV